MRIIVFIIFFCTFSCKETGSIKKDNNSINRKDSIVNQKTEKKHNYKIVLDSIHRGASFYEINSLKNFIFIEEDPYENPLVDNNIIYGILVYQKDITEYAILVSLEENIKEEDLSYKWKKTIIDYVKYPKKNKRCWHHSFINEKDIECCLYVIQDSVNGDFKSWRIDFENQKFKCLDKFIELECY